MNNKKLCLILLALFAAINTSSLGAIKTYDELKNLAQKILSIKVASIHLILASNGMYPKNEYSKKLDYDMYLYLDKIASLDRYRTSEIEINKKFRKKFILFAMPSGSLHPSWFILAASFKGNIYFLKNFEANHFNDLIRIEIGKLDNKNDFYELSKLYLNSVGYTDYGREFIEEVNFKKYKSMNQQAQLPKVKLDKDGATVELCTFENEDNKIFKHTFKYENLELKSYETHAVSK